MTTTYDEMIARQARDERSLTRETSLIVAPNVPPTVDTVRSHLEDAQTALQQAYLAGRGLRCPGVTVLTPGIDRVHIELMGVIAALEATVRLHDELMCLGEDGGLWLAPGHHDADQMRAAVAAQVDDIYLPSEVADTPVAHVWVTVTEDWVEIVPPGTPGAEPHTRLLL